MDMTYNVVFSRNESTKAPPVSLPHCDIALVSMDALSKTWLPFYMQPFIFL